MAKLSKIKFHSSAFREILSSPAAVSELEKRTTAIQQAAGGAPDFESEVKVVGGSSKLGRAMGYVRTASQEGRRAEAEDRALTRAIDAGR